jgi:SOS response regulatory protein OraA/RecX
VTRSGTAFEAGIRALARRDLTAAEVEDRLGRAGFAQADRRQAIAHLQAAGYLDDRRAACERARVLAERGLGDLAITADLSRRGASGEAQADALASLEPELDRARRLVARLGPGPRSAHGLARKGFTPEAVEAAVTTAVAEEA